MDTKAFFEYDFQSSLYPLKTNLLVIRHHHLALEQYISKILSVDPAHINDNFLPQTRVHAAKPGNHLRRTVVLDPVASYFLYDLVFRRTEMHSAFRLVQNAVHLDTGLRMVNRCLCTRLTRSFLTRWNSMTCSGNPPDFH